MGEPSQRPEREGRGWGFEGREAVRWVKGVWKGWLMLGLGAASNEGSEEVGVI